jgi:hypothetical protein
MDSVDRYPVGRSGESVFFRRTVLTRDTAISWYRSIGNGSAKTPIPSRPEDVEKVDGVEISVSNLIDDPAWPHLGLPMGAGILAQPTGRDHPAPFMGDVPARIHRRFGSNEGFETLLADSGACTFIGRRMHMDLRQYPEYLGSVALVVPDPIIKQIDNFMLPASAGRGERIFYRFVPRPGQTLDGLTITTFDEQAHLLTSFEMQDIPSNGILDVDKGSCIGTYGYVVTHREHGVLLHHPSSGFLRQVGLNLQAVGGGGTKISVPIDDSPDSARMEYWGSSRPRISTNNVVGEAISTPNVNARVAVASFQREKIASAEKYRQRWFANDSREAAMRFVQNEIKRARSRILVADPYLGALQLGQFLYAAHGETVKIVLMTTSLAFSPNKTFKLEAFETQLNQLKKIAKVSADVYVLAQSLLHDRFLVIDDAVWFLGNSLNALGDKASIIVKLPNPDEVIHELKKMLINAQPFDQYRQKQLKAPARKAK